jgi:hypothetical protein
MKSKQFRHIPTGDIVTQVPLSRIAEYEELGACGGILDDQGEYRIFCEVSGGITGYNSAYLKANGIECRFNKDDAEIKANELTATMNRPNAKATFKYTPELI